MKTIIKINGKKVGEVEQRNLLHFQSQLIYRAHKEESKKIYKRCRDKRVCID